MTYLSVVSRDSVWIALTITALIDLDMLAYDIQNAYFTADCRERVWVVAGPEFGSEAGTVFRSSLLDTLDAMGYRPS